MEKETIIVYIIGIALIIVTTMQRSKNEELMDEKDTLLLPLFTFFGFLAIYISLFFIEAKLMNLVIMICFSFFGYLTLISNAFYLCEFTEYEIETKIYDVDVSSSEFSEIMIEKKHNTTEIKKIEKKKGGINRYLLKKYKYLKKIIVHMTVMDFFIYLYAFIIVLIFLLTHNHMIAELITMSFCFQTVREVKLDSVINGYTHLFILIFYDCVWLIFYKEISYVIRDINVPIKLILPKQFAGFEMFGLGDIFIPALFISVVKRYGEKRNCKQIYLVSLIGLCAGIITNIILFKNYEGTNTPGMLIICPVLGIFPALYAAYKNRFSEFIWFKRKHPQLVNDI